MAGQLQVFNHINRQAAAQPLFRVHFKDGCKTDMRAANPAEIYAAFRERGVDKVKLVREDQPRPGIGGRNHE